MAKLLAQRGLIVTIIMTPLNALRFQKLTDQAVNSSLIVNIIELKFPCQEAGLPEGCENMDSLPSPDLALQFFEACNMLQEPIEKLIVEDQLALDCIISDSCLPWTADVAIKFNIPRIVFHGISCFTLVCSHNLDQYKVHECVKSDTELFLVPDMPDRIEFTKAQLPRTMASDDLGGFFERMKVAELSAQGVMINTFEELEPEYIKRYRKVVKKVWCIGPVSLCNKKEKQAANHDQQHHCLKWLDSMKPSSVVYVCFGSLCHISPQQVMEIGLGLKASNHPFIWVIRAGDYSSEIDQWLKEERFEESVGERGGLIIRGWAPQVSILSHKAIGGFLTHCGWNSTLEGVSAGVPMITWPMSAEQFYNEKLIDQVLRIGVRIGVKVMVDEVMVRRERVKEAVEELMGEGEEGGERRKRAKELGEMANRAIEGGGSSYLSLTLVIDHIMQQVQKNV